MAPCTIYLGAIWKRAANFTHLPLDPSVDNSRMRGIEDWVGDRDGLDQVFHTMNPIESLMKPAAPFSEKSI